MTPLNLVIQELRQWRQPTLMLVGNHDQVHIKSPWPCSFPGIPIIDRGCPVQMLQEQARDLASVY